jgi:hypothetical protein
LVVYEALSQKIKKQINKNKLICTEQTCSFLAVLGFELKAYTLSHSTSPFFVKDFF